MTTQFSADQIKAIEGRFKSAQIANDADGMMTIARTPEFVQAALQKARDEVARSPRTGADPASLQLLYEVDKQVHRTLLMVQKARVAALEKRIAALEARPSMKYRGVWKPDEYYFPGDLTTHGGSMFYCWATTKARPGENDAWQLCVKRGADGKSVK